MGLNIKRITANNKKSQLNLLFGDKPSRSIFYIEIELIQGGRLNQFELRKIKKSIRISL